jgi:hypothetical protein
VVTDADTIERLRMDVASAQSRATTAEKQRTRWQLASEENARTLEDCGEDLNASEKALHEALNRAEKAEAALDLLRLRWWNHHDECSILCTDACDEMHTFEQGCALDSVPAPGQHSPPIATRLRHAEAERDRYLEALQDIIHASRDEGMAAMIQWMRGRAVTALTPKDAP